MHEIVATHPTVAAVLQKQAQHEAEHQVYRETIEKVMAPYREAVAEWDRERISALKRVQPVPPRPPEPDLGDTAADERAHVYEMGLLRAEMKQALAQAAPELEERFAAWEQERFAAYVKAVAELQRGAQEFAGAVHAAREWRLAVDTADPDRRTIPGLADRTRQKVTAHDVLDAVARGGSLLALEPLTVRFESILVEPDGGYRTTGRLVSGKPPDDPPRQSRNRSAYI